METIDNNRICVIEGWWRHNSNFMKCIICDWNGPCDTHRIDEQGKYTKENCLSICPNCHTLYHRGDLQFPTYNISKDLNIMINSGIY